MRVFAKLFCKHSSEPHTEVMAASGLNEYTLIHQHAPQRQTTKLPMRECNATRKQNYVPSHAYLTIAYLNTDRSYGQPQTGHMEAKRLKLARKSHVPKLTRVPLGGGFSVCIMYEIASGTMISYECKRGGGLGQVGSRSIS